MNQDNYFPWDDIHEERRFPTGNFQFAIEEITDGFSNKTGNRMFTGNFRCVAPPEFAGKRYTEYYVTGSEEKPNGNVADSFGSRSLKALSKAANVQPNQDILALIASCKGQQVVLSIRNYKDDDPNSQYFGEEQNSTSRYRKIGEVELGPAQVGGGAPVAQTVAGPPPVGAAAAGTAAPTTAPTTGAPAQAAPATAAPVAAAAPAAQPVFPTAPPAATSAPAATPAPEAAAPAAPVTTTPPPAAAPQGTGVMLKCTMCGETVPQADFPAHVQSHAVANQG